MNGTGLDWLRDNSPNANGTSQPAPPVSFGAIPDLNSSSVTNSLRPSGPGGNAHFPSLPSIQFTDPNGQTMRSSVPGNSLNDVLEAGHAHNSFLDIPSSGPARNGSDPVLPMRAHSSSAPDSHNDDLDSIPLSLQPQELTLEESKTYMRWYSNILARTNSRTVSIDDVFNFLANFKIPEESKERLASIFAKSSKSINIGGFFALLRLIAHALAGELPTRNLIKKFKPPPVPLLILSKKRRPVEDDDDDDEDIETNSVHTGNGSSSSNLKTGVRAPLDLDSFTQFMLTGHRPEERKRHKKRSKKVKSVKFSDQIVTDVHESQPPPSVASPSPQEIDYSLPMDQLLARIQTQQQQQPNDAEEAAILKDMESQMHFQNLNSVDKPGGHYDHYLKPNMTGPAQMMNMYSPSPEPDRNGYFPNASEPSNEPFLQPNMTGPAQMQRLVPNVTGPADMARLFLPNRTGVTESPKVSLQSFTDQMTGLTQNNTLQNSRIVSDSASLLRKDNSTIDYSLRPLPPPPVPNRRGRLLSSPTPRIQSPQDISFGTASPPIPPRSLGSPNGRPPPPPPPPSRRRATSSSNNGATLSNDQGSGGLYSTEDNDSTANLLTDLKALQDEVNKIRDMTGGF